MVQNKIIDNVFSIENTDINYNNDYLGYIEIPRFDIKRLIKYGTSSNILDNDYVGLHKLSGSLDDNKLIILAGHNISNVFSKLHSININDTVYINTKKNNKKFIVYDKKIVNEYDTDYLKEDKNNELILITCTNTKGERLLVMLKEDV